MRKLFLDTIQEVENLKKLLNENNKVNFRYMKLKRKYLFNYPEELHEKVIELGY